jgi:polyhydroxyalkanoate synthesis regulator phasin
VDSLGWDLPKVQAKGTRSVRRFSRQDSVQDLLDDIDLRPENIDVFGCVQQVLVAIEKQQGKASASLSELLTAPIPPPARRAPAPVVFDPEVQLAMAAGEIDKETAIQRLQQQERRRSELEAREMEKVPERLDALVQRGVITAEEGERYRALRQIEARQKSGEIDQNEADRIRNSVLHGEARDRIEKKIREVVAESVRYLEVFESMKRISYTYDDALSFLIRYKRQVVADKNTVVDMAPVVDDLLDNAELLKRLIDIMERRDPELRMVAVRLPPYSYVMGRGLEKIKNLTIIEMFIDELRHVSLDDMSQELNSPEPAVRVRPAADMKCLVTLVDHVVKKTRFRKELRLLRVNQEIRDFYRNATDMKEARNQAESFVNRRLRRLFPDLSPDETAEIRKRSTEFMESLEQQLLAESRAVVDEKRRKDEEARKQAEPTGERGDDDDLRLSEEEMRLGVQIGRVEMRVAGGARRVPYKIMPDPENSEQYIIVQRDRETGELVPQMRRNAKRVVERDRDGAWHVVS